MDKSAELTLSARIPLRNRAGEIVAYTLVDDEDFARFGSARWSMDPAGYARRTRWVAGGQGKQWTEPLHRAILGLERGNPLHADHINRDPLDNRRANLRAVTNGQNSQNVGSLGGGSNHRGVAWDPSRNKWRARVQLHGREHVLGRFETEIEAHRAVVAFRAEHMPFSADALEARAA